MGAARASGTGQGRAWETEGGGGGAVGRCGVAARPPFVRPLGAHDGAASTGRQRGVVGGSQRRRPRRPQVTGAGRPPDDAHAAGGAAARHGASAGRQWRPAAARTAAGVDGGRPVAAADPALSDGWLRRRGALGRICPNLARRRAGQPARLHPEFDGNSAVVTNRGWDTNAILGHVDPPSVTESACAGSHTQVFPTNLCG